MSSDHHGEISPEHYIDAAGRRLIWHADWERAGDFMPPEVVLHARDWFVTTSGPSDLLVGFIRSSRTSPQLASDLAAALDSLYRRHPRKLTTVLVVVGSDPSALTPEWESVVRASGSQGATAALLLADPAARSIQTLAGRPPRALPAEHLNNFTIPDEAEFERAAMRQRPRRRRASAPMAVSGPPVVSYTLIGIIAVVWLLAESAASTT
ncbi:MAG: hypothetical protein WD535_03660, partial [Thermaerobacterales bacterium]